LKKIKKPIENINNAYRYLYPRLTVLVSSGIISEPNALTIAWSSPLSANPPLVGVSITNKRYSHEIISQYKEFVVNIPNYSQIKGSHYIGQISGREEPNKLTNAGFSVEPSNKIKAPRIKECQINLECTLQRTIATGDHDLFVGEIVEVVLDPEIMDDWSYDLNKFRPIYWRQSKTFEETFTLKSKKQ
jgi:flavin reductase (DIM6/NTAB) family NADH-FMN oxidoreductase RutF